VLLEHAVAGEHAEDALEVLGIARGEDTSDDLGGREWGVGTAFPDGIRDVEADDGVERHGHAYHVGQLHYCQPCCVPALSALLLHALFSFTNASKQLRFTFSHWVALYI
jgi:hypothetical protein